MRSGEDVNKVVLRNGYVALVNFEGDHIEFYPRRPPPDNLIYFLAAGDNANLRLLASYLVTLARVDR